MPNYRYGRYVYGPDPLALPFDVRGAVDEMGDAILAGASPADALRELLRRGLGDRAGRRGLDDLLRRVRERQREIRGSGRLDGRDAGRPGVRPARHGQHAARQGRVRGQRGRT